jgi:hypothetical protein
VAMENGEDVIAIGRRRLINVSKKAAPLQLRRRSLGAPDDCLQLLVSSALPRSCLVCPTLHPKDISNHTAERAVKCSSPPTYWLRPQSHC